MAFTLHGDQNYSFGFQDAAATTLATSLGFQPEELQLQGEPEFEESAKDADGETVAHVVGAEMMNFTMRGYLVNATLFSAAAGSGFQYDGRYYIISNTSIDEKNTDFVRVELTGKSYPRIDSQTTITP